MTNRRLFFALWPEANARNNLIQTVNGLNSRVPARWIKPQKLHITLAFLGDVEEKQLNLAVAAADKVEAGGFELLLDRVEYWPGPKILCLTPTSATPLLEQLAADLAEHLQDAGFDLEQRPYRAHLTLARNASALPMEIPLERPIHWLASNFALVESRQERQGTVYATLKTWPLLPANE